MANIQQHGFAAAAAGQELWCVLLAPSKAPPSTQVRNHTSTAVGCVRVRERDARGITAVHRWRAD
eukprot:COSAG02_NODE_49315_length_327_cov_1.315789_1_plen_64_part_10